MEYFYCLIGTAVICSLGAMLVPDGESGTYVKLVGGLCVICALISPLSSMVGLAVEYGENGGWLGGIYGEEISNFDAQKVWQSVLEGQSAASVSDGLRRMLCSGFGLDADDVEVYAELDGDACRRVSIVLSGKAVFFDPHEIIEYTEGLLGCKCDVVYR